MKGIDWYYELEGTSGKPVIIFLHGFLGSAADWKYVAGHFNSEFQCLRLDLPGHGQTVVKDQRYYAMPETAQQLIHLMDRLKIHTANLVGYSLGGRLALFLAAHFPERIERMVLESASPGLRTEKERSNRCHHDRLLADRLQKQDFSAFLHDWYEQPLFHSLKSHPHFQRLYRDRLNNKPRELALSLRYMGTGVQPSLWKYLPQITLPFLILVGEKDRKFRKIASQMHKRNPEFRIGIVEGSGHSIHLENTEKYVAELEKFMT